MLEASAALHAPQHHAWSHGEAKTRCVSNFKFGNHNIEKLEHLAKPENSMCAIFLNQWVTGYASP